MEGSKRTNYIFVDFENTQAVDIDLLTGKSAVVLLVIGGKQKSLPVAIVRQLLAHADQVHLIESSGVGKNALDFILAYHIGQWVKNDPTGYFHIISKDKGFDPLVTHLQQQKVLAARYNEFTKIPLLTDYQKVPVADRTALLMERLAKHQQSRPAKRDSLIAYINSMFGKQLSAVDVLGLVHNLEQRKLITINQDNKVSYYL